MKVEAVEVPFYGGGAALFEFTTQEKQPVMQNKGDLSSKMMLFMA